MHSLAAARTIACTEMNTTQNTTSNSTILTTASNLNAALTSTFAVVSNKFFNAYRLFSDAERDAIVQFAAHNSMCCDDLATATDPQGVHTALLLANRDLYAMLLVRTSGLQNLDRQLGVYFLLTAKAAEGETRYLTDDDVGAVIAYLLENITQPRDLLRPFEMIADAGINRSSIQRFSLRFWLNHAALMSYATNFGGILSRIFTHTWGKKNTTILRNMMQKQVLFEYEEKFLYDQLLKYVSIQNNAEEIFCALLITLKPAKVSVTSKF